MSVIFALCSCASAPTEKQGPGLLVDIWASNQILYLIYEAARTENIGPVETRLHPNLWTEESDNKAPSFRRYVAAAGYDVCSSASPRLGHGGVPTSDFDEALLFQPYGFAHELVRGRCVISTLIEEPEAGYVLEKVKGGLRLRDRKNSAELWRGRYQELDTIWSALSVAEPSIMLTSRQDRLVRSTAIDDDIMESAIRYGGIFRGAASELLADRLFVFRTPRAHSIYLAKEAPTSEQVLFALIDGGGLADDDSDIRRETMLAMAAIATEVHQDVLLPVIFKALDAPSYWLSFEFSERAQLKIDGKTLGDEELRKAMSNAKPAYTDFEVMNGAGALIAELGEAAAEQFVERYRDSIIEHLSQTYISHELLILAAALSPQGEALAIELLRKGDASGWPTDRRSAMQLVQNIRRPSEKFIGFIKKRCSDHVVFESPVSEGDHGVFDTTMEEWIFCDVQRARFGDHRALARLVRAASNQDQKRKANFVMPYLFIDLGNIGLAALRGIASAGEEETALAALSYLCELGPFALRETKAKSVAIFDRLEKQLEEAKQMSEGIGELINPNINLQLGKAENARDNCHAAVPTHYGKAVLGLLTVGE